jgi:hypothetical protein
MDYEYKKPTEEEVKQMDEFRKRFAELHELIENAVAPGRSRSIALTNLEESNMWLNKGICNK